MKLKTGKWTKYIFPFIALVMVTCYSFLFFSLWQFKIVTQDPTLSDGGTYKCTAANDLGESNANITLNFQGKSTKEQWRWHNIRAAHIYGFCLHIHCWSRCTHSTAPLYHCTLLHYWYRESQPRWAPSPVNIYCMKPGDGRTLSYRVVL